MYNVARDRLGAGVDLVDPILKCKTKAPAAGGQ
jgi:hypothetical protein